jgi:hypothetical protein
MSMGQGGSQRGKILRTDRSYAIRTILIVIFSSQKVLFHASKRIEMELGKLSSLYIAAECE